MSRKEEGEALLGPSRASQAQGMGNWEVYPMERKPCLKEKINSVQHQHPFPSNSEGRRVMQHLGSIPTSGIQNFGEHPHLRDTEF